MNYEVVPSSESDSVEGHHGGAHRSSVHVVDEEAGFLVQGVAGKGY